MRVRDVMRADPVTVSPATTVADARRQAEEAGVRHLVVVDGSRVIGVVEEDGLWIAAEDVLRTAAGLQGSLTARDERAVRQAMHPATPLLSPQESLETAARVMLLKHRTGLPVIDGTRLAGILTVDECRRAVGAPVAGIAEDPDAVAAGAPEAAHAADPEQKAGSDPDADVA